MVTSPRWRLCPYKVITLYISSTLKVYSIGDVDPTRFAQIMNLGWPWSFLRQGQIWFLMHLYWKNLEMFIFLYNCLGEIRILAKNVKPIETLVLYNISTKGQADLWSFIQGHSYWTALYIYLSIFFSEFTGLFELKFHMIKQYEYDIIFRSLDPDGHCPYMVKQNLFK